MPSYVMSISSKNIYSIQSLLNLIFILPLILDRVVSVAIILIWTSYPLEHTLVPKPIS